MIHCSLKSQYDTSNHLDVRIQFHQQFSTNPTSWFEWYFHEFDLSEGDSILDVGCGTAMIWAKNADKLPDNIKLVVVVASKGMIETAKQNLSNAGIEAEFFVSDICDLPFQDEHFDVVTANHMLYHVPNEKRENGIATLYRILKNNGILYASTIGENHLKEITELLRRYDSSLVYETPQIHQTFGLQNGEKQLDSLFGKIHRHLYNCNLKVTQARPLVDYVLSTMSTAAEKLQAENGNGFFQYVNRVIHNSGYIFITKETGYFQARKIERF